MQFQYTAVNNENKKLNGFINAVSEENARSQLNDLGLAVLSIQVTENVEETSEENAKKLKFEALDKNGKKVIGTIPEKDLSKAYRRLVEEYSFQVLALYELNATEEEKEAARIEISTLQTTYDLIKAEGEVPDILTDKEKEIKIKLLKEVQFVIAKVNEILEKFGDDIKSEERKNIEKIEDRLSRLKNSNNLNFIKQTCEELLQSVQSKEIYLHQDEFVQERERIKLETQKLLLEVHKLDTNPNVSIFNDDQKIKNSKFNIFKKKESFSPKVRELQSQIKIINGQILDYIRIWLKASKELKPEVKSKIRELRFQRKGLKIQLKGSLKEEKLSKRKGHVSTLDNYLIMITGWLLGFYLFYYFVNYYLSFKSTFLNENFYWQTNIFSSPVFTYLILTVFLLHISLQTKHIFMKNNKSFNYITYPAIFIIIVLVNINF